MPHSLRPLRRLVIGIVSIALPLVLLAQEAEKELPERLPASPGIIEAEPDGDEASRSEAPCPCFDIQDLVALSAHSWDLCQHDPLLVQVTRWVGDDVPPQGRIGYHVLTSLPNPRSGSGTCQFFLRDGGDHEIRTLLRRWPRLEEEKARLCFRMITDWLDGLGDCPARAGELDSRSTAESSDGSSPD